MPYVKRSEKGIITELHKEKSPEHSEYLAGDHEEVVQFLNSFSDNPNNESAARDDAIEYALKKSDRELARVTEDLISLLIDKKVIVRNRHAVVRNCLRITVGSATENKKLIEALNEIEA